MKLENIKLEDTAINSNNNPNNNQRIISEYNFGKDKGLSEDRTFCLLNCCPTNYCKLHCDVNPEGTCGHNPYRPDPDACDCQITCSCMDNPCSCNGD